MRARASVEVPHSSAEREEPPGAPANGWGAAGLDVSLIGLLATFGILSPIGLLLSTIGLTRAPRGKAIGGALLGAVGTIWMVATLLNDEPRQYESGPYGTIHCAREIAPPAALAVRVVAGTPNTRVQVYFTEERLAHWASRPAWTRSMRGQWWLGLSAKRCGTELTDDSGVASFECRFPPSLAGERVLLQAAVRTTGEGPDSGWELTDAVQVTILPRRGPETR